MPLKEFMFSKVADLQLFTATRNSFRVFFKIFANILGKFWKNRPYIDTYNVCLYFEMPTSDY